jgi:hypothetical protein
VPFPLQCMLLHSFRELEGGHLHSSLSHSGQFCSQQDLSPSSPFI